MNVYLVTLRESNGARFHSKVMATSHNHAKDVASRAHPDTTVVYVQRTAE